MLDWLKGKPKAEKAPETPLDVDATEFLNLDPKACYLLDLRDLATFRQGHIKGAHQLPYVELNRRMHELPTNKVIVTVDTSERRGKQAAKLLKQSGLDARNLKGGMAGWTGKLVK